MWRLSTRLGDFEAGQLAQWALAPIAAMTIGCLGTIDRNPGTQ